MVIRQASVGRVSIPGVEDLRNMWGLTGIDKSRVSRMCMELDEVVEPFRNRPLEGQYPLVWLDALYLKVRQNHRIVSQALVIATGVRENGEGEVLGFALGASEEDACSVDFLHSLVVRWLRGAHLVTSDAHEGLKGALEQVLARVSWQRCRVHFIRNLLAHVPRGDKSIVAAALRTVFAQPGRLAAGARLAEEVQAMRSRWPKAAQVSAQAEDEILAYLAFPPEVWTRIYSTNLKERANREIKRRTNVVGVLPDGASAVRQAGSVRVEAADDRQVGRRFIRLKSMAIVMAPQRLMVAEPVAFRLAPVH